MELFVWILMYIYLHDMRLGVRHLTFFLGGGASVSSFMGFPSGSAVKNLPVGLGDSRDASSIPESRSSPRGGPGSPLQYSCLENPMARGAWQATVHRVTKSLTQLK